MSSIPAAVDKLVATLTTRLGANVQVVDGPPVVALDNVGVAVGYTPDDISVSSQEEGAGLDSDVETYDINCLAWVRSGDGKLKPVRDRVFALLAQVDQSLAEDRRLGGAVVHARIRVLDMDQTQKPDGTWAVASFAVTCKAFK